MDGEPKTDADHELDMYIESLIGRDGDTLAKLADQECKIRNMDRLAKGELKEHLGVIFSSPNLLNRVPAWKSQLANETTKEQALKEIVALVVSDVYAERNPTQL